MKLEDEIKQTKPFKSEIQKLLLNIAVTSSYLNNALNDMLKPYDLTPHQYNVLRILKGKHPESYCNQDITQRMIDKSSNATRIVDKLLEKKLVIRSENKTDRRQVNIKINDKGIAILDDIEKNSFSERTTFKNITDENAKQMNLWLDEIRG